MDRMRVFLVDESADFLAALAAALEDSSCLEVVGKATNGEVALREIERLRPDAVVLDVRVKPMGGFEAARRLKAAPWAPVVLLTTHLQIGDLARRAASGAGADGVLTKSELPESLPALARRVMARDPIFGRPGVARLGPGSGDQG